MFGESDRGRLPRDAPTFATCLVRFVLPKRGCIVGNDTEIVQDNTPAAAGDPSDRGLEPLLEKWNRTAKAYRNAHYAAAVRLKRLHYWLGIPALVLSTIVGTTVFATLETALELGIRLAVGLISVLAAALGASQTFLRFAERAEKHMQAYSGYASIVRDIEYALHASDRKDSKKLLAAAAERVKKRIDELANSVPELSEADREAVLGDFSGDAAVTLERSLLAERSSPTDLESGPEPPALPAARAPLPTTPPPQKKSEARVPALPKKSEVRSQKSKADG